MPSSESNKDRKAGAGMAKRKEILITELYAEAVRDVASSPERWISFLKSASRNYRLPFDEQLLVHVQRPNATAVLELEKWNRLFGRWVRKGSTGIAVLDKRPGTLKLKYYYDISDTQESYQKSLVRPVPLWRLKHSGGAYETGICSYKRPDRADTDPESGQFRICSLCAGSHYPYRRIPCIPRRKTGDPAGRKDRAQSKRWGSGCERKQQPKKICPESGREYQQYRPAECKDAESGYADRKNVAKDCQLYQNRRRAEY